MSDPIAVVLRRGEACYPVEVILCHDTVDRSVGQRESSSVDEVLLDGEPIETTRSERDDLHDLARDAVRMRDRGSRDYLQHLRRWDALLAQYRAGEVPNGD